MTHAELNLDEAAQQAASNWQDFNCFVWFRRTELDDADDWSVIYPSEDALKEAFDALRFEPTKDEATA